MTKRALIILLFITLIGSSVPTFMVYVPQLTELDSDGIPVDYYEQRCPIPFGVDVETWLTTYRWHRPYEENEWDCSVMSAYTEWALENCGYQTDIVLVTIGGFGHAYVWVKIDGARKIYESTSREWFPVLGCFNPKTTFASIYRLYSFFGVRGVKSFDLEWGWWLK